MALRELSRREILQAVAEYDRLGRVRFLEKYEFGPARSYRLVIDGKTYDSKAIVGAAHGFLPGQEALTAHDFSGGAATVGRLLSRLGFEVTQAVPGGIGAGTGDRGTRFGQPRISVDILRLESARRAVLLRSEGHCENPGCTGEAQDITDAGRPILDVDHIQDLAQGGPDHPEQMIALCPNCDAIKTRGRTREQLRHELATVARQRTRRSCPDRNVLPGKSWRIWPSTCWAWPR